MASVNLTQYVDQFRNLNTRDVSTWPILPRVTALVGIVIVVLLGAWYFYWSDQLALLQTGEQEEEQLKVQYKDKLQQAINLEPLKRQKQLAQQYVARLEKQLPSKAEMDALLSDINQAGIGRGLQFELFRPGQVTVRDYYAELPISIRLIGSYHDIASFTSDIASLPRIVTLNNINIAMPNNATTPLALEATAKTFRYLDADEVAAQRKGEEVMARRALVLLPVLVTLSVLSACSGSNDELRQWMSDVRKDMRPVTPTIAEPKTFEPFIYQDQASVDPFDPSKVTNALKALSAQSTSGLAPDLTRRREPLEAFPLDTISMVGTLQRPNLKYALLKADSIVYQIKVGNYVGQNFGLVTRIDDNEVTLREVVQDAAGEWVERATTLQLQEKK